MSYRCDLRDELAGASASAIFRVQVLRLSDHAKRPSKRRAGYSADAPGLSWPNTTQTRPRFVPVLPC